MKDTGSGSSAGRSDRKSWMSGPIFLRSPFREDRFRIPFPADRTFWEPNQKRHCLLHGARRFGNRYACPKMTAAKRKQKKHTLWKRLSSSAPRFRFRSRGRADWKNRGSVGRKGRLQKGIRFPATAFPFQSTGSWEGRDSAVRIRFARN